MSFLSKIPVPTRAQFSSFGRHIVSYVGGAVTVGVAMHFATADQGSQLTTGVTQIVTGIDSIVGGIATLFAVGSALYAGWTASPASQMKAVVGNPDNKIEGQIVTTPAIAAAVPNAQVVSK